MRDCKIWLGLPRYYGDRPRSVSSQVLREIIKGEMRNAPNTVVLNRRYQVIDMNLRLMLEREELRVGPYSRLKILSRGEYEKRYEALRDAKN